MKQIILLCSVFIGFTAFGQNYPISQGGVVNACGGTMTDDGVGGAYTDTPYTITICPDVPGDVVQVNFAAFSLQTSPGNGNSDQLYVYDGMNTSAPPLGPYSGSVANLQITATINNPTGCLTFVFDPNGPANAGSPGWEALIECTTPCANPSMVSAITNPQPDGAIQTVSVCMNAPVSFSGAGSAAQPGFTIGAYTWDFDDGTSSTGITATHSFEEPGEYLVNLTVTDNNGCNNLNVNPLQVLVSTKPTFSGMEDLETCLGETVIGNVEVGDANAQPGEGVIGGGASGTTWTNLPPQVVSGLTYLADGAGFSFSSEIIYDFFEPDQVLENCEDLWGIMINMEHSYMGDLGVFVTCPNGTSVTLVDWGSNGGGTTFLGEPVDGCGNDGTFVGVGYDYEWAPDATNGTWGENANDSEQDFTDSEGCVYNNQPYLPAGSYEAAGDLCDLVGCPLNGTWSIGVTDNLGADNGYIFEWGLNLNPALYPGVTTFTPTINGGPDSSYWAVTGPFAGNGAQWITDVSPDADQISITPEVEGTFDFTYVVINNFGCQFDTTIQVTITQAPQVTAGPDQLYSCGEVQLEGGLANEPPVACSQCGVVDHCYAGSYDQTFCPDVLGAGLITVTFLAGSTQEFQEYINVYDGPDTWPSPYIGGYTGDLTGLTWTSTSETGCITFNLWEWDGVGNCVDGTTVPWSMLVTASSAAAANFVWDWDPATGLDLNTIANPTVLDLTQTTTYTLIGHPEGHPACSSMDEVIVSVDPLGDPGQDATITICSTDAAFEMIDELGGSPVTTGLWYDDAGVQLATGTFSPSTDAPGFYEYRVAYGNCEASAILNIQMALPTVITAADDSTICEFGTANLTLNTLSFGQAPFIYDWAYNGISVSAVEDFVFTPTESGMACITVTDACGYSTSDCFDLTVRPAPDVVFSVDTTDVCWPHTFELVNDVDPTLFSTSKWEMSDGAFYLNTANQPHAFEQPGSYTVTLTVTNELGCAYATTKTDYLNAYASPTAGYTASPQPTDIKNAEVEFTDASIGNIAEWLWTIKNIDGSTLAVSPLQNPTYQFPTNQGGEYPIQLMVTDIHNCVDYVSGVIDINDIFEVFVPNSFTPNGDGVNDVMFVQGADIDPTRFSFIVFNRWGDVVFETNDFEIPWTGDVKGGDYFAPNGTYNWIAVAVSESTGVKRELKGYINIFR
jgi:gliding motility-associated-like protein